MAEKKTHYRTGIKRAITDKWRADVAQRLGEIEKDPRWLARQIGASDGAVYAVLSRQQVSGLVDSISTLLKIQLPLQAGDKATEAAEIVAGATAEQAEKMLAVLRAMR